MKEKFIIAFLVLSLAGPPAAAADLAALVQKTQPAVATVLTYDIHHQSMGFGSGFFVDDQGHLITNYHVVEDAYAAEVRLKDGTVLAVEAVVAENAASDLVRLRVARDGNRGPWLRLSPEPPRIAERVMVVGSPMGLEQTVSEGIVSALRTAPGLGRFFQISAPISRGSSGGPVLNMDGEVVGVVSFMVVMGQNLNFAVSSEEIEALAPLPLPRTVAQWTYDKSLKEPSQAEQLCRQGFHFSINGEYDRALEFYRSAAAQDPTNETAWYGLGYCYSGINRPERAVETFQQAIRINPENAGLRLELGRTLARLGRHEEAVESYREAARIDPELTEAYSGMAVAQSELGRYEDAMDNHRNVIRLEPGSSPAHFNMGITLSRLEKREEAVAAYRQAVRLDPENIVAHHNAGILLSQLDRPEEAAEAHKHVLRLDPANSASHYHLGRTYLVLGDKGAALDQYRILMRIDPALAAMLFEEIYP